MPAPIILWIDSANNKLAGGWNSFVTAPKPMFKQGDEVDVTLRWIKRPVSANSSMEEIPFDSSVIDLEVGNRGWRPDAGKWYLQFDGENTELLDYNISAEDLENSLNTVSPIVTAGGVSVSKINDDGFKIVFAEDGAQSALTGYGEGLSPISSVLINTVTLGSASTKAVFWVSLRQSVVSEVTTVWSTETAVVASVQSLKSSIWDIYIDGQPKDGFFTVSVDAGTPFAISVFATQEAMEQAIGNGYTVVKQGDYRWRVYKDDETSFTVAIGSSAGIISFSGKTAKVLIDSGKAAEMLAGITESTSTLQVSVTTNGNKDTILQTPCLVVAAVNP